MVANVLPLPRNSADPSRFAPDVLVAGRHRIVRFIANDALRRFNAIFDYTHLKIHFRPNQYFAESFCCVGSQARDRGFENPQGR